MQSQSYSHFIPKLNIVEEEADESLYWLDLINKSDISKEANINLLIKEADELTQIFTSARKTASFNKFKNKSNKS